MKRWRLIAVCALVAVSAVASHATAQYKAEFKNSLVVGPTGPWGEAAVKFADLSPLKGRRVFLWPDNDPEGQKAMVECAELLIAAARR
jgi:hypothetical protein